MSEAKFWWTINQASASEIDIFIDRGSYLLFFVFWAGTVEVVIIEVEFVTGGLGGLPKEGKWIITAKHYKQEIIWH